MTSDDPPAHVRLRYEDPFATPNTERRTDRRLRGRLPSPVTVFTSGQNDEKAGLTISSLVIAEGEPAVLLAVVDPLSRLQEQAIETGRLVVHVLGADEARIAGLFAGNYPGDPFEATEYEESEYGPVLVGDRSVVRCRYLSSEPLGFQGLLRAEIRSIELADDRHDPLVWYRGRYRRLSPDPD